MKKLFLAQFVFVFASCTELAAQQKQDEISDALFLRCITKYELKSDYFYSEIGLLDSQVDKLKKSIDQLRSEITIAYQRQNLYRMKDRIDKKILEEFKIELSDDQECEQKVAQIKKRFLEQLDEQLLTHQIERLKQVVIQRYIQKMRNGPAFETPLMWARILPLDNQQVQSLESKTLETSKEYLNYKIKLKTETWNRLQAKLPADLQQAIRKKIGPRSDRSEGLLLESKKKRGPRKK